MAFNTQFFRSMPPVTKNLILVNVFIYIVMQLLPTTNFVDKYLALHYFSSPMFNVAQLFTYMFIHAGFMHLFFNMFALFFFGPVIEWTMGSRRFLFFYISCGIGAALIQEGVYAIMLQKYIGMYSPAEYEQIITEGAKAFCKNMNFVDPTMARMNALVNGSVVGASGSIYGVLLAFGMLYPNRVIYLLVPPMPVKAKYLVIGYVFIELFCGLGGLADNVAHFAHLGGMLFGFIIIYYWKKKGMFNGLY